MSLTITDTETLSRKARKRVIAEACAGDGHIPLAKMTGKSSDGVFHRLYVGNQYHMRQGGTVEVTTITRGKDGGVSFRNVVTGKEATCVRLEFANMVFMEFGYKGNGL